MPISEAEKYKGNSLFVGEYTQANKVIINKQGYSNFKNVIYKTDVQLDVMNKDLNYFTKEAITLNPVPYTKDILKNKGGILKTYRFNDDSYSYQEFTVINTNEKYIRFWNISENKWNDFKDDVKNKVNIYKETENMDKPITSYEMNSISVCYVDYTKDTFKSTGGTMTTYRLENNSYSYQTYTTYNSPDLYIRKWEDTAWGEWIYQGNSIISDIIVEDTIFDSPITDFLRNKEYSYMVNNSANAPISGHSGIYKVYRYGNDLFSYSTWKSTQNEEIYGRRWVNGTWTAWHKMNS